MGADGPVRKWSAQADLDVDLGVDLDSGIDSDVDADVDADAEGGTGAGSDARWGGFAKGGLAAGGVRPGLAYALGLTLLAGVTWRPGRRRPSPAGRPAKDGEAFGCFGTGAKAVRSSRGESCSSAYAWGAVSSRSDATVIAHRVRSLGVTG